MGRNYRFTIPKLTRMREAGSPRKVWRSVNNKLVFELERHLAETFGVDITLSQDDDPNTWQMVQRLLLALERAGRVLDYVFAEMPDPEAFARIDVFERWLAAERNAIDSVLQTVLGSVVTDLLNAVALRELRTTASGTFVLDGVVEVAVVEGDEKPAVWSSDEFHAFISYKHRLYSQKAQAMCDELVARGLLVWLDRAELPISPDVTIRNILLKRKLKHALSVSRHTIFFQTIGEAHADENFRGEHVAHNWQSFEQRYARDLIYVNPNGDLILDGQSAAGVSAQSAIEFLDHRCRESSAPARREGFGPIAGLDPDLDEASSELRARLSEVFGGDVTPSPLAEIALLAPGSVETGQAQAAAYGNDVLVQLLRYDAASALELQRAGLDPYWTFAVGAKLNDQRWQRPREWLIKDVFGPGPSALHERIRAKGTVSTADILVGILNFAVGHSFPRDMLRLALRAGRRDMTKEMVEGAVDEFRSRAFEVLQREERELGVHGWLFIASSNGLGAFAVSDCGRIRTGSVGPGRLLAKQSPRLFPPDVMERFGAALSSRRTDDVARILEGHKEIARTLTGAITVARTQDMSRPGSAGQLWLVGEADVPVAPEYSLEGLSTALDTLRHQKDSAGAAHAWPWDERPWQPCVLVAPVTRSLALELSPLDLIADVLEPLDAYLAVRTLEYDDF